MKKTIFDDITPRRDSTKEEPQQKRNHSIRDVTPLETQERSDRRNLRAQRRQVTTDEVHSTMEKSTKRSSFGIWAAAIILLIVAFSTAGLVFFGKTVITIVPRQKDVVLTPSVTFTAYKKAAANELQFTVLDVALIESDTIAATGSEIVNERAAGRITIYNTYNTSKQRLIKNTRFQAPNGEIYRIRNSIIVPGMNTDGTSGSVTATVYADKAGVTQNINKLKTRFTIPGLKNGPRYTAFYAELTTPITGGFSGKRAVVDPVALDAMHITLQKKLTSKIESAIAKKIAPTALFFKTGIFPSYETKPISYLDKNNSLVSETVTIKVITFNKNDISRILAGITSTDLKNSTIRLENPSELSMKIINKEGVSISSDSFIQFTLSGDAKFTWITNTEKLKKDLFGKNKMVLDSILEEYSGIKNAYAKIQPFWKSSFPTNTNKIIIKISKK